MENCKNSTKTTPYVQNPELICQLCFDILREPKTCSECLEANFCSKCAEEALIKNPECPNCHSKWSDKSVKINPLLLKFYQSTPIKCQKKECKCKSKFEIDEVSLLNTDDFILFIRYIGLFGEDGSR